MDTGFTLEQTARYLSVHDYYGYDETKEGAAECTQVAGAILELAWLAAKGDESVAFDLAAPVIHMIGRYNGKLDQCTSAVAIDFICDQTHGLDCVIHEAHDEAIEHGQTPTWLDTSPVHPAFSVFHGGRDGEYPWFTRAEWLDEVATGETDLGYWERVDEYREEHGQGVICDIDENLGRM